MPRGTVESLKQAAAEALVAWRSAEKAGDHEKSTKAEASFNEAHAAHKKAEANEERGAELSKFEKEYLDPQGRAIYNERKAGTTDTSDEFQRATRVYLEHGRRNEQQATDVLIAGGMSLEAAKAGIGRAKTAHRKAFLAYCTHPGENGANTHAAAKVLDGFGVGPTEKHTMMVGDNERGGFLVPDDRRSEVMKDLPGSRVMRSLARVERTNSDSIIWPSIQSATEDVTVRTSKIRADQWSTEGADAVVETDDDLIGEQEIRVHDWQGRAVVATRKLLSAASGVEGIILALLFESFTADEDKKYFKGTGAGEAFGCMTDDRVATVNSGHASELTFVKFMEFLFTLPAQYAARATLLLKRMSLKDVMLLENPTTNDYVWDPTKTPDQIMGYTYAQSEFVDGVGAGNKAMLLGDFKFGYVIVESEDFRVLRLDQWKPPKIAFLPIAQVGGKIVRPNAFVRHKIAA